MSFETEDIAGRIVLLAESLAEGVGTQWLIDSFIGQSWSKGSRVGWGMLEFRKIGIFSSQNIEHRVEISVCDKSFEFGAKWTVVALDPKLSTQTRNFYYIRVCY